MKKRERGRSLLPAPLTFPRSESQLLDTRNHKALFTGTQPPSVAARWERVFLLPVPRASLPADPDCRECSRRPGSLPCKPTSPRFLRHLAQARKFVALVLGHLLHLFEVGRKCSQKRFGRSGPVARESRCFYRLVPMLSPVSASRRASSRSGGHLSILGERAFFPAACSACSEGACQTA